MEECKGTVWNVIGAASTMSQLAGVIAGFVFACIIVLLTTQPQHRASASERLRALVPFVATFVAMGLNAYVFGLLSGEQPEDSCRRVWTATVVASGMLAIGTVAAVCGIVLLVRAYLAREHLEDSEAPHLSNLERLLRVTMRLLAIVAPGLLVQRIFEYLRVWYAGNPPGLTWLLVFVIVAAYGSMVLLTVRPSPLTRLHHGLADDNGVDFYDRILFFAGVCTVLYSLVGTGLVGFFLGVVPGDWRAMPAFVPWTVAALAAVVPMLAIGGYLCAVRGLTHLGDEHHGVKGEADSVHFSR
jgi:hypothetical protein